MANIVKKVVKNSRNRFLAGITKSIDQLNSELEQLDAKIDAIRETQQASLNETREKMTNSGTVRLSDTELVTKIFSGIKIYLDPRDISVTPHIALDYIWEKPITHAWLKVIKPGDTILDIGANFGYFGALAAQYGGRKSKVIFFEANPHLLPYINKTLSVNWLNEQSVVENLAVADKDGKAKLNVLKDYIGSSSLHSIESLDKYMHEKMHLETQEAISVQAVSIDSYCQKNKIAAIDLIKMDIEGYEEKAYAGMRKTIQASPNATMFVEFTHDSYENPKLFYEHMLEDFKNVYLINEHGAIIKPRANDYKTVIGDSDDWVMPIFSKNSNLAND
jgi:FkbM family methyltransferase